MMKEEKITRKKEKYFEALMSALGGFYTKVSSLQEENIDENQAFIQTITKAHEEWQNAERFFHSISDPDLVDHAIYKLEAARTRYVYLLKKAKEEGIKVNFH